MKALNRLFPGLVAGLVCFAMVWGTVLCMVTSLSLPLDTGALLMGLALGLACYALVLSLTHRSWWALVLVCFTAGAGFLMKDALWESTQVTLSLITDPFHRAYPGIPQLYEGAGLVCTRDCTLFLGFFGLILGFFAVFGLLKGGGVVLPMPMILIGLMVSMAVTNFEPDLQPLLLTAAGVLLGVIFTQARLPGLQNGAKTVAAAMVPVFLFVSLLPRWVPREDYVHPDVLAQITASMEALLENVSQRLQSDEPLFTIPIGDGNISIAGSSDPEERLELGGLGDLNQSSTLLMRVNVSGNAPGTPLYLRSQSYGVYTGTAWEGIPAASYTGGTSLITTGFEDYEVRIRALRVLSMIPIPTGAVTQPRGAAYYDQYLYNNKQDTQFSFTCTNHPDPMGSGYTDDSIPGKYRDLTTQQRAVLAEIMDPLYMNSPEDVANYLRHLYPYSLTPEKAPEDQDFVTWFLTEAESGYCVHFASTAVLMLRYLGYPARLATGYLCQPDANGQANVTGKQAHAWAEYYVEGQGWVILEATPAEGIESTAGPTPTEPENTQPSERTPPEDPTSPSTRPSIPQPSDTEPNVPVGTDEVPSPTNPALPTQPLKGDGEGTGQGFRFPSWLGTLAKWVLGIVAAAALVLLRWALVLSARRRRFTTGEPNQRALAMYRYLQRLRKFTGSDEDLQVLALVKKARFSQHQLPDEELSMLQRAVAREAAQALSVPLPRRWWRRFVRCV